MNKPDPGSNRDPLRTDAENSVACEVQEADVVVYTATAAGVAASIAAARMGARVLLLEPGWHVGGMLSGGLSHADVLGQQDLIGGITAEIYRRIAGH